MLVFICLQDKFLQPNPTNPMSQSLFQRREDSASLGTEETRAGTASLPSLQSEEQQSFGAGVFLREMDVLQARVTGSEHSSAATHLKTSLACSTFLSSRSLLWQMTQLKIEKGCGLSKDWNVSVPVGWNIWRNIFASYKEPCIGHVLPLVRCSSRKAAFIFAPWHEELPGAVSRHRNHRQDSTEHTRKPFILRTIGVNSEDIGWSLLKEFL